MERLSTHTHAFGTYYVIKHFTGSREKAWLREAAILRYKVQIGKEF